MKWIRSYRTLYNLDNVISINTGFTFGSPNTHGVYINSDDKNSGFIPTDKPEELMTTIQIFIESDNELLDLGGEDA